MTVVDANYILRWFLNDVESQAKIVDDFFNSAEPGSLMINSVTIAEVTYVLRSMGYAHSQVYLLFRELQYYPTIAGLTEIDKLALQIYRDTKFDFEDCVLISIHRIKGYKVATFDKDLLRMIES